MLGAQRDHTPFGRLSAGFQAPGWSKLRSAGQAGGNMNRLAGVTGAALVLILLVFSGSLCRAQAVAGDSLGGLKGLAALEPIDAHTHLFREDPAVLAFLKQMHMRILDIYVMESREDPLQPMRVQGRAMLGFGEGHVAWCTTIDPYVFDEPGYAARTIKELNEDFAHGAIAVKIYKSIGMEIKKADGQYLMPDDPVFKPIYQDIAAHHRTVVAHIAEPDGCWEPPAGNREYTAYYSKHPEWYMYEHPDHPAKATILAARDRMLAENPNLRVVGAHLGSMESNLPELARHLDRYPNFAVDTAARMEYLMLAPRDEVRALLIKYQDRILYGTDAVFRAEGNDNALSGWEWHLQRDWRYLSTDEQVEVFKGSGQMVRGLALPKSVLRKIYHENAVRWFPGLVSGESQGTGSRF
jgi:predicted TIM-barrel fold metal-dependent hydrolase